VMRGGGSVHIRAHSDEGNILIVVNDTGPGIRPEVRSRLFQPFVTFGKKNGLGLGLALSRQTLLDHGGDLWANGDGPGAEFQMRLPKERREARETADVGV
jgi:signal transduction histidine kinase